jgi:phytoene dehydrogenase-like protein
MDQTRSAVASPVTPGRAPQVDHDVVVIGAGHNRLTCAAYLARAGLRVLVLERRTVVGGAAVTEEIAPGYRASIFSYLMSILHPRIQRDLVLARHGLKVLPCSELVSPVSREDYIQLSSDVSRTQASFARFSRRDAETYPAFDAYLGEAERLVRQLLWEAPVDPTRSDWRGIRETLRFAWKYRRVGRGFYRVVDLLTMSAYDYLREWFEDERVMAVLAYYASIGTFAGPRTPGSAYVIMHHMMGEGEGVAGWGFVRGGMGSISQALAAAGRERGVRIVTGAEIREVRVRDGRAVSVVTAAGDEYRARAVASNASAPHLYLSLLDPAVLPPEVLREARGYRTFSTAFKMNIACERPPQWLMLDRLRREGALGGLDYPTYMHIAPDVDYLERAFEDAKHGRWSQRPFITPVTPTIVDDTLAPEGRHVVNLFGGHAPYELRDVQWDETQRAGFRKAILDTIEEYAPGFSGDIVADQLLVPKDLERIVNLPQGHIFHGELAPDQLFFQRPVSGFANYRTPVRGLYVCGSSMHPGGGVSGIPGHNAARGILRDWKVRHL